MITPEQRNTMKKLVDDFENSYFQDYLKRETTPKFVCPDCGFSCEHYLEMYNHIVDEHTDTIEDPTFQALLNPLTRVRTSCGMKNDPQLMTMGKFFGDIISSSHNQHALINIIGKTGMGKSNASMYIGTKVSEYLAQKLGGKPSDYFSIDNIAIMKLESIIPIIESLDKKQYNVIVLDDIGASYSARDFQKSINKNINKIFQTFRDTNTLVILTMPDTFLIDKVARKLAHFQIELVEKRHDQGVTVGKLTELVEQYRGSGKTHYHFIVDSNGIKYPRVVFRRVESQLANQYEKKRSEIRASMMQDSIDIIRQSGKEESKDGTVIGELPKYQAIAAEVDYELTINPSISERALGAKLDVSRDTAAKAKKYALQLRKLKIEKNGYTSAI